MRSNLVGWALPVLLVHQEVPDGGDGASEGGAIVRGNPPPPMLKIETCTGITGIGGDEWNVQKSKVLTWWRWMLKNLLETTEQRLQV